MMAENASTLEVDRVPQVDDSEIYWHEATSENGKKYQIGVLKSDHPNLSEEEVKGLFKAAKQRSAKESPDNTAGHEDGERLGAGRTQKLVTHTTDPEPIHWTYTGNDDSWKKPAQRVTDLFDIKKYCLCKNFGGYWNYKLWIDITQDWDYKFYDEAGNCYKLSTYQKGVHYVRYDSTMPDIVRIVGTS